MTPLKKVEILNRERVHELLATAYNHSLTIVEAPMGYGKTTAVRSFIKAEKLKPLWISFLHADETPAYFWEKFSTAIGQLDETQGHKLRELGFPQDVPQIEKVFSILNEINYHKKTILVIDDFHLCNNMLVNKFLMQLVFENIDNLHIIVITRDTTNIQFAELLSKGLCDVVSQQKLKFTEVEIHEYCQMVFGRLDERDLKKISEYTEGWISLIYMILLGMENGIPIGMSSSIDELIENVLFKVYDPEIRGFLLKLSVMDVFTGKQAHFVTEKPRAVEILKRLNKENAFVYYDQVTQLYKIHNVLLDFLRMRHELTKEDLKGLYTRLGEWFINQQDFITAYGYFYKAGDWQRILSHLNDPRNIRNELTEFEGAMDLFENTPTNELYLYPLAYLQHILLSIVRGDDNDVLRAIQALNALKTHLESETDLDEAYKNHILAEILIFKRFTSFNRIDPSGDTNAEILRLLNGRQSYIMSRENEFTLGSPHLLYVYFRDPGTYKQIAQLASERFTTYTSFANGCGAGCEYLIAAEYALETGDLEEAASNGLKAIYKARTKDQTSIIICANFTLMRLAILENKPVVALERLKVLEQEISSVNNSIYNTSLDMCRGYIYACLHQPDRIPHWLATGNMTSADLLYQGVAFNYIVYGKALLLSKNYLELEVLTDSFHQEFSTFSNQLGMIHNGIFKSIAAYHVQGPSRGLKGLSETLAMAEKDNILMPFVENAPHLSEMIKMLIKKEAPTPFLEKLASLSENYGQVIFASQPIKIKLTQRETEILKLVAKGLTREAIATELFLSQGTVKTHLKNIYDKLNVNSKISAIKTAQLHQLI